MAWTNVALKGNISLSLKEEKEGEKSANAEAEKEKEKEEEEEKKAKPQKKTKISDEITVELIIKDIFDPTADILTSSKKK